MMTAAVRGPRAAPGPVTLRDFLELACDSSSDGFRSYPRCLPSCTTDDALHHQQQTPARLLAEADHILRRSPSRSPGPGALARISSLSRSFSRRIKEGLWRRRDGDDDDDLYFDDRDSCGFPSPLVSSCSASDSSEYGDDVAITDEEMEMAACPPPSSECDKQQPSSSSSTSSADHDCTDGAAPGAGPDGSNKMMQAVAEGDPAVGRGNGKLGMHQDRQQLSPVSVLDFPFDDDDGDERSDAGTCSPSFQPRCPPPPRTTTKQAQVLHKIRRYDGIAEAVEPVDLEARFTTTSSSDSGESVGASTHLATTTSCSTDTTSSSSIGSARHGEEHQSADRSSSSSQEDPEEEEEPDEYRLLARLLHLHQEDNTAAAAAVDEVSQVLMLDFFAEGLDRLRSSAAAGRDNDKAAAAAEALVVAAAAEWLRGAGPRWAIRDVMGSGKAALEDMERGRRWMRVDEEQRDVGAAVEGSLMDGLLDELVAELVPSFLVPRQPVMAVDDACPV